MSGLVRWGLWTLAVGSGCALAAMAWQRMVLGQATGPITPVLFAIGAGCLGLLWSPATRASEHVVRWGWRAALRDALLALCQWAERQAAAVEHRRVAALAAAVEMGCEYQADEARRRVRQMREAA